ncbi:helix-turn-helix domain-containing protein [Flectobacillus roseus]|uniref:helix-turn-helix domain-containing protein n=1 Tax=Flectobacillus roseus TaxID=502259 RepID=UPI0024B6735A|nr:helix-turn-helix transcriptional regulator [Flectobacillus roseus]MDI9872223.1 helix-turn-helix transcriptional regulator [Flectobacillus roseus]
MKAFENPTTIPLQIKRKYKQMPLSERRKLYNIIREELGYGENTDNSNIRKMLRGQRNVTPQIVKRLSDFLGLSRQQFQGNIQMDIMDIVGTIKPNVPQSTHELHHHHKS